MKDKSTKTVDERLAAWEKWLYACYGAAFMLLALAICKAGENTRLTGLLFTVEQAADFPIFPQYYQDLSFIYISPWRLLLWLAVEITTLGAAAVLTLSSRWRRNPSARRRNLILGYLLAGWVTLLSLGAQDPINVAESSPAYNILVVVYLLSLGLGYWWSRRKRERAEEIFP